MNFKGNLDNNNLAIEDTSNSYEAELVGYDLDSVKELVSGEAQLNSIQSENIEPLPVTEDNTNELVFIDSNVKDSQVLIDNLVPDISGVEDVVLLNSDQDELLQITEHLSNYEGDLDVVHIVSHGEEGELSFANAEVNSDTLPEYVELIGDWGDSLSADADLLLYGCDVSSDPAGNSFVEKVSQLTGADIAASVDDTGIDGDWELETVVGEVEATSAFNEEIASLYEHTLVDAGLDAGFGGGGGSGGGGGFDSNLGDRPVDGNNDSDGEDDDDDGGGSSVSFPGDDLFDADFYLEQNPDVAESGVDPLKHYDESGRFEGRDPNNTFDTSYYLERNPDVAEAGINPLEHYDENGRLEGRYPNQVFESFGEFGASEGILVASENLSGEQYQLFKDTANGVVSNSEVEVAALPILYYTAVGGIAVAAISLELIRQSIDLESALRDAKIYTFPGSQGSFENTPPFDLGEVGRIVERFPNGNQFLDNLLDGQFEFPLGDESIGYFLSSEQETYRNINIEGRITDPELTDYERTIGENLVAEGNQLISVDDGNVRKSLEIPKGTQAADYLSVTPSGRFNLTEVKGSEPGSAGAEVSTAITQLRNTYDALIEKVPGAKLGKVEVAVPEGAPLKGNYEVSGNQIIKVTAGDTGVVREVVRVGGKVVTIRR